MFSEDKITTSFLLAKAWPIILANASVPLLGLVDTAVIGNLGSVEDLGAIAFGSLIFSFVYWSFGFLRMATTGFVAQAQGAEDQVEVRAVLGRSLLLAAGLGVMLIALQWPIAISAFALLDGSDTVENVAQSYFSIRIWGAPATLSIFVLMGVLIGLGKSKQLLAVQLFLNGLNAALDVLFAGIFGWGADGIAFGTIIAEWTTVVFSLWIVLSTLSAQKTDTTPFWSLENIRNTAALKQMLSANADIMIRTLLLIFSFAFFTNQSAQFGTIILATNHILLQLISFAAFFLDGYAFVVESLVGKAIGAKHRQLFDSAIKKSTLLAVITALLLALCFVVFGDGVIALLTDIEEIQIEGSKYLWLAGIYVAFSFAAFQLDGIFIGASCTRQMRNASILSIIVFLGAWWLLVPSLGVEGLWCAMIVYVIARAAALMIYFPAVRGLLKA